MKRLLSIITALVMTLTLCMCADVSVSAADAEISLPYSRLTVTKGKSITLTPKVSGVKKYTLEWSSSNSAVASVNSDGKVSGKKNGTAVITVKIKNTDALAKVKITVGKRVTSVVSDYSGKTVTLKKGETLDFTTSVLPADASDRKLSFSTSNKKVAKISTEWKDNGDGVIATITAVKPGTAKITVKAADGSGKKSVITVKVTASGKSSTDNKTTASQTTVSKPSTASTEKTTSDFNKKLTSADIVNDMTIGWNLGNSLDATGGNGLNSETSWGNPKTTEAMIKDIRKAGFNTVRIPVSWGNHIDKKGKVDAAWMKRVKEVVDYAYDNGMYVILNSHHDNDYYNIGGAAENTAVRDESVRKMENLWTQIAKNFKDYDERLIFETMNEPRTPGSSQEWMGGTDKEREVIYAINEAVVSAVRKTGGNNAYRHIMVPCYGATSNTSALRKMKLPDDDRIIMSVHAYNPYNFAMNENGSSEFTQHDKNELDRFFKDLNSIFVSKGTPVIIGEFGATNKDNLSERISWAEYYVSGAGKYGIKCVVWDNNSGTKSGGECFGLYNRASGKWVFPELIEAMTEAAK